MRNSFGIRDDEPVSSPHSATCPGAFLEKVTKNGQFAANTFQRWMTVVCLLLVVVLTSAEAIHIHPDAAISRDGSRCLLCFSLHANAPVASAQPLPVRLGVTMFSFTYEVQATGIASRLELFTRPPPSAA